MTWPQYLMATRQLKLPRWGCVQCRASCSNNAGGRTDVSVHGCCCFKQNSCQLHAEREKKTKKQPKCTWRVYCRIKGTSSSAFPISEGCNVNSLSLFLSFQLTQLLIQCDFLLAFIFMLFFSDFYLLMGAITLFFVCLFVFHIVCVACATHISSSLEAAQSWGRGELTKTREVCLALSNWTLLLLGLRLAASSWGGGDDGWKLWNTSQQRPGTGGQRWLTCLYFYSPNTHRCIQV